MTDKKKQADSTGIGEIEAPEELATVEGEIVEEAQQSDDHAGDDQKESSIDDQAGKDLCVTVCDMVFNAISTRRGDHWKLQKDEAQQLGGAFDAVLSKYLPGYLDKAGPEVTLGFIASMIILPRLTPEDNDGQA